MKQDSTIAKVIQCVMDVIPELEGARKSRLERSLEPLLGNRVHNGQVLTAEKWNELVDRVEELEKRVGVNAGILNDPTGRTI